MRLITRAHVAKILFDGRQAQGVRYTRQGRSFDVRAGREVLLCGGAVNSPQVLQLSGIGAAQMLRGIGIDPVLQSAHVGQNLRDHLGIDMYFKSMVPTLNQILRPWTGRVRVALQYLPTRKGPLSLSINQGGGFIRTSADLKSPDLQLYFSPVSYTRAPVGKRPMMRPDAFPVFSWGPLYAGQPVRAALPSNRRTRSRIRLSSQIIWQPTTTKPHSSPR